MALRVTHRLLAVWLTSSVAVAGSVPADLSTFSLEDLMNVEVTSVSRKQQRLARAGAAVYVITQEDIRRSGASNIPDLLRMAPGVNVAQITANTYGISIRGFVDRLADKVLVLIDGRTVYTPTTSGVYWDQQDLPLDEIDRIEVIRGPGGTVWGANAMNGVINIITKSAEDTQGGLVSAGAGSQKVARGSLRYGGRIGRKGAYRAFGKYSNTGSLTASDGKPAADGWHISHGGFRSDWTLSSRDTMTIQGDLFQVREGQTIDVIFSNRLPLRATIEDKVKVGAGDLLGRWQHIFSNGSDTSLQVYYDRYKRFNEGATETLNTVDVDFDHHLAMGRRHSIIWGLGYRVTRDDHLPGYQLTYSPLAQTNNLFSVFVQDEIALSKSLWLTAGSKVEHNAYTGAEYEPSAQLVWTPTKAHTLWISAAQAIKQPSRDEAGLRVAIGTFPLEGNGFGVLQVTGDRNRKAERLRDFEIGYRSQVTRSFSLDIATFAGSYRHLRSLEPGTPFFTTNPAPPHLVSPLVFDSKASARTYGIEASANWNVTRRWRISPGFNAIHMSVTTEPSSRDPIQRERALSTPQRQFQIRSQVNLTRRLDWDSALYHVGRLRDGGSGEVPRYNRVDTRLAWRVGESTEFSIVGQNLLSPRHAEFHNTYEVHRTLVERSVFGKVLWRF